MKIAGFFTKRILFFIVGIFFLPAIASTQTIPLPNAYAHNDYWHKRPVFDALDNGFTHLEADIFLQNGTLVVAHTLPVLKNNNTLESLYLQPLLNRFNGRRNELQTAMDTIVLMVDIKSDAKHTYIELIKLLTKYKSILSSCENGVQVKRNLTIVLTGHRPVKLIKTEICRMVFVDENLRKVNNDKGFDDIYTIASCRYGSLLKWKGRGTIPTDEKKRLCALVSKAHLFGKKVRLWASPENETVWHELLSCGVDLINTDKLAALRRYFIDEMALVATANKNPAESFTTPSGAAEK